MGSVVKGDLAPVSSILVVRGPQFGSSVRSFRFFFLDLTLFYLSSYLVCLLTVRVDSWCSERTSLPFSDRVDSIATRQRNFYLPRSLNAFRGTAFSWLNPNNRNLEPVDCYVGSFIGFVGIVFFCFARTLTPTVPGSAHGRWPWTHVTKNKVACQLLREAMLCYVMSCYVMLC